MPIDAPATTAARGRIRAAYDPQLFSAAGSALVDALGRHLTQLQALHGPVLNWTPPADNVAAALDAIQTADHAGEAMAAATDQSAVVERFVQLVRQALAHGQNLHHPGYIGHQVSASLPIAGLFDTIPAVTNQGMAIYEMGPWANAAEQAMVATLGQQIGWQPGQFAGLITSGGSLANLTALLTARNVALGDAWEQGVARDGPAPVVVVHGEAHYSVVRAVGITGIGTNHVIRAALDDRGRIDPDRLDDTLAELRERGTPIVAVCAAACATRTGAFDPLNDIADVCRRHDVWLHVDAAHGGAACLSERYRHLVAGLDRADSVVWDAHKMLFMPALCAFVFYRDKAHRFAAFEQDAPYLFDETNPGAAEYDSALKTVECTKRAAAIALWGTWALFGRQLFADMVDVTFDLGLRFHQMLRDAPDFEPLHEPQCNIVVFRHVPDALRNAELRRLGQFQLDLRRRIIESGRFYIVPSQADGAGALRVTIINPLTTQEHLASLMQALRDEGRRLLEG